MFDFTPNVPPDPNGAALEARSMRYPLADQSPSVSQALEVARTLTPNGLLADIAMPGENGYDLIEQIRAAAEPELHGMAAARTDGVFEYRRPPARGLRRLPTADA